MKMAAIPYLIYPHSISFPLPSLLLLYLLYEFNWLVIIREYQPKKMKNNEKKRKDYSMYNF